MRKLPPFPELVAFEAIARHRSFTRAADELCITQSAVSHRVRRLEAHFGVPLVRRMNPGVDLTEAGKALLPELQAALDGLAGLGTRRERKLRVAAASALCTWWLAGRLAKFMRLRPGISVELLPIENTATSVPEVDVRILWMSDREYIPSETQAPLFNELVFPVCSPRLMTKNANARSMLDSATLLHKSVHATGEWNWNLWLDRAGVENRKKGGQLRFADMGLILSAAVEGSGVALARSLLAHDALADGRLVALTGVEPMVSEKKHVARWRKVRAGDPDITAFVAWLVAESQATLAATEQILRRPLKSERKRERKIAAVS